MNGWVPNTVTLPNLTAIGASQTNVPISKKFPITASGSKNIIVCITTSAAAGTVTAYFRTSLGGLAPIVAKSAVLSGANSFYIKLNSNVDTTAGVLPLLCLGEVVVTTEAASSVTISSVQVLQED